MLTWDELVEAGRLMQDYGELRPGFVDHDAANSSGPSAYPYTPGMPPPSPPESYQAIEGDSYFSFEYDAVSGEVRFSIK